MALGCRGRDDGSLPKRLAWFAKQDDWQNYGVSAKSLEIVWWNSKKVDKFWCEFWNRLWQWIVPYTICQCMSCLGLGSGVQAGNAGSAARKPLHGLFETQPKSKQFETIPTSNTTSTLSLMFCHVWTWGANHMRSPSWSRPLVTFLKSASLVNLHWPHLTG